MRWSLMMGRAGFWTAVDAGVGGLEPSFQAALAPRSPVLNVMNPCHVPNVLNRHCASVPDARGIPLSTISAPGQTPAGIASESSVWCGRGCTIRRFKLRSMTGCDNHRESDLSATRLPLWGTTEPRLQTGHAATRVSILRNSA